MQAAISQNIITEAEMNSLPPQLPQMNRTYQIENAGKIEALIAFCPNYLLNIPFKYQNHRNCLQLYISRGPTTILRPVLAQASYKNLPILLLDSDSNIDAKFITVHDNMQLILQEDIQKMMQLVPPQLKDKNQNDLDIIQIDTRQEMLKAAQLLADVFQHDPVTHNLAPLVHRRWEFLFDLCHFIAQQTSHHGMNWIVIDSTNQNLSQCPLVGALLASPAGITENHWGDPSQLTEVMKNYFHEQDFSYFEKIDQLHHDFCGAPANHLYISFVASLGKSGVGGTLLRQLAEIAARGKGNVYLENSKTENVKFYEKMGLKVRGRILVRNQPAGSQTYMYAMNNCEGGGEFVELEDAVLQNVME